MWNASEFKSRAGQFGLFTDTKKLTLLGGLKWNTCHLETMNSKISQLFHKWRWGKNSREDGATVHLFFKLKPYNCKKRQNLLNFVLSLWCNLNIKSALKKPHELNIKTGLGQHKQWRNCITCNLISLTLHRRDPRDKVIKLHNSIRIIYDPLPWTKYSRGKFYL